jgi:hypothetical protein
LVKSNGRIFVVGGYGGAITRRQEVFFQSLIHNTPRSIYGWMGWERTVHREVKRGRGKYKLAKKETKGKKKEPGLFRSDRG